MLEALAHPADWAAAHRPSLFVERCLLIGIGAGAWLLYFPIARVLDLPGSVAFHTAADSAIPFWPQAEWVYVAAYPMALFPAFFIRDVDILRRYVAAFVGLQVVAFAFFVLLPIRMSRIDDLDPGRSLAEWGIALTYALDPSPMKCFPSLHVTNTLFAALLALKLDRKVGRWALAVAVAIAISTLLVKQHYLADVVGGVLLAVAAFPLAFGWERDLRPHPEATFPRRYLAALPLLYLMLVAAALGGVRGLHLGHGSVPPPPAVHFLPLR